MRNGTTKNRRNIFSPRCKCCRKLIVLCPPPPPPRKCIYSSDLLRGEGGAQQLHWVPGHVGLAGNERADELAKAAHSLDTPGFEAVTKSDEARHWITDHTIRQHPDPNLAAGRQLKCVPSRPFSRADCSRLRTHCAFSAARRHL